MVQTLGNRLMQKSSKSKIICCEYKMHNFDPHHADIYTILAKFYKHLVKFLDFLFIAN